MSEYSIIEYFGSSNDGKSCGYCKKQSSRQSHGLWAHQLQPPDYQAMVDRGWRRSGKYCYKTSMSSTCCPHYTIRCNAIDFKPSKSHKKVIKRFRAYILSGAGAHKQKTVKPLPDVKECSADGEFSSDEEVSSEETNVDEAIVERVNEVERKLQCKEDNFAVVGMDGAHAQDEVKTLLDVPVTTTNDDVEVHRFNRKHSPKPGVGPDPNKKPAKKKKYIRREKALLKQKTRSACSASTSTEGSQPLADDIIDQLMQPDAYVSNAETKHTFKMRLVSARRGNPQFDASFNESFQVYRKYQVFVHKDKPEKCTESNFLRFLCDSPLVLTKVKRKVYPRGDTRNLQYPDGMGAFHQQYLVDGKIICVGVLDVLPLCLSSVYFYYDPDFAFLSLGTLSSLFEISFTRNLQKFLYPDMLFYYMGFYIHSCPKMRYKAQYNPSWLLCPETYTWVDVRHSQLKLNVSEYSRLADISVAIPSYPTFKDLSETLVLHQRQIMDYDAYRMRRTGRVSNEDDDSDEVLEYVNLIGVRLSKRMLLFRQ